MIKKLFKNKKWIKPFIIVFGLLTTALFLLSCLLVEDWVEVVAISFVTTYYMSCLRPLVGYFINRKYHNKMDYNRKWFLEKNFENKLYNFLKVKKWKYLLPTYNEESFNLKTHSLEEIMGTMCQAEVVHESMLILSLVPLFFIIFYGTPVIFILTSYIFIVIEALFIIVQRYNRHRIYKILKYKNK